VQENLAELHRFFAGKIVINGPQQLERLIQLLIVVKDLRAPGRAGEALFSTFSATDLAAILHKDTAHSHIHLVVNRIGLDTHVLDGRNKLKQLDQ
jgi:hypothetical protein